jgi:hypothetical protein
MCVRTKKVLNKSGVKVELCSVANKVKDGEKKQLTLDRSAYVTTVIDRAGKLKGATDQFAGTVHGGNGFRIACGMTDVNMAREYQCAAANGRSGEKNSLPGGKTARTVWHGV